MKITNSMRACWQTCQRKCQLRYFRGLRSTVPSPELEMGTKFHAALEAMMNSGDGSNAIMTFESAYTEEVALALYDGYAEMWGDVEWQTVATEEVFDMGIAVGKVDALVWANGELWIVEHKTTCSDISAGSSYWDRLELDTQIDTYLLAFPEAVGVIYDVIRKPSDKPKNVAILDSAGLKIVVDQVGGRAKNKNGTWRQTSGAGLLAMTAPETPEQMRVRIRNEICNSPETFYSRREVRRTPSQLEASRADIISVSEQIAAEKHFPRNPRACFEYGRRCEFHSICAGFVDSLDLVGAGKLYVASEMHEELV